MTHVVHLVLLRQLDIGRQPELVESRNDHIREVNLPPLEPVSCRELELRRNLISRISGKGGKRLLMMQTSSIGRAHSMVVVVPALAKGEEPDERIVAREIASFVLLPAPYVADGVDGPGYVIHKHSPEAESPEEHRPTAKVEHCGASGDVVQQVCLAEEAVEGLGQQVRGVVAVAHTG